MFFDYQNQNGLHGRNEQQMAPEGEAPARARKKKSLIQ